MTHLAPVGWQQINLIGDYLRDADTRVGPDGFRPPRRAAQTLHAAARSRSVPLSVNPDSILWRDPYRARGWQARARIGLQS